MEKKFLPKFDEKIFPVFKKIQKKEKIFCKTLVKFLLKLKMKLKLKPLGSNLTN